MINYLDKIDDITAQTANLLKSIVMPNKYGR